MDVPNPREKLEIGISAIIDDHSGRLRRRRKAMATTAMATPTSTAGKNNRGKDQIHWSEEVWKTLDHAVLEEMMRTRVVAKFLPHVRVERKQTNAAADVVVSPIQQALAALAVGAALQLPQDTALYVDESLTRRIQEYWVTFKMSVAQVEEEEHAEAAMGHHPEISHHEGPGAAAHHQMAHYQRASTGVSLAMRSANILAQAEDAILLNGQNAVVNSPLFFTQQVIPLDTNLKTDIDLGLLNIQALPQGAAGIPAGAAANVITLPAGQVIAVHPVPPPAGVPAFPPLYRENTLNAVAEGFSALQGLGHYENYALVLHTYPYADLHQALPTTLIEPVEPVSHLIKAGIHGTGTLPPFTPVTAAGPQLPATGLPTLIQTSQAGQPLATAPLAGAPLNINGNVLYTGVLVSLSGNTMDHVRGRMDEHSDVVVTFNQKDQNEQYRFRVVERFCLRLKDPSAVILLLFMDA
jgi:hypothetical protein